LKEKTKSELKKTLLTLVILSAGALLVVGYSLATDSDSDTSDDSEYTVAQKLSAIDTGGDTEAEAEEFQDVLDCIRASGIEGAETEIQISDTLVAGWEQSGGENGDGELLELGQALCSG
jgi:hypothetical protein